MRDSRIALIGALVFMPWLTNIRGAGNWAAFLFFVVLYCYQDYVEKEWDRRRKKELEWLSDLEKLPDRARTLAARAAGMEKPGDDDKPD